MPELGCGGVEGHTNSCILFALILGVRELTGLIIIEISSFKIANMHIYHSKLRTLKQLTSRIY